MYYGNISLKQRAYFWHFYHIIKHTRNSVLNKQRPGAPQNSFIYPSKTMRWTSCEFSTQSWRIRKWITALPCNKDPYYLGIIGPNVWVNSIITCTHIGITMVVPYYVLNYVGAQFKWHGIWICIVIIEYNIGVTTTLWLNLWGGKTFCRFKPCKIRVNTTVSKTQNLWNSYNGKRVLECNASWKNYDDHITKTK